MTNYETVKTVTRTVTYSIREWPSDDPDGSPVYDWIDSDGDDSDTLFESVEEAERDIP